MVFLFPSSSASQQHQHQNQQMNSFSMQGTPSVSELVGPSSLMMYQQQQPQNQHQNKGWIKKQDLKLLKLENMKREKEKIEREVQFQNDKRKRLNMTNSFVPNNLEVANKSLSKYAINNMGSNSVRVHGKKHPIKNGPQMIDLSTQLNLTASHPFVGNDKPNIAHSTVFLWRNVMRGNNMLERYLLKKMDKKIRTNAHREVRLGKFPAKWDLRGV